MTLREKMETLAQNLREATASPSNRIDHIAIPVTSIEQMQPLITGEIEHAIKEVLSCVIHDIEQALKEDEQEGDQ